VDRSDPDLVSALVARRRGRARLRAATLVAGAASLAGAGVVAYHLPSVTHTGTVVPATGTTAGTGAATVHATSGGSQVAASTAGSPAQVHAANPGPVHATSGGSAGHGHGHDD
jgi:hypothetical protein